LGEKKGDFSGEKKTCCGKDQGKRAGGTLAWERIVRALRGEAKGITESKKKSQRKTLKRKGSKHRRNDVRESLRFP